MPAFRSTSTVVTCACNHPRLFQGPWQFSLLWLKKRQSWTPAQYRNTIRVCCLARLCATRGNNSHSAHCLAGARRDASQQCSLQHLLLIAACSLSIFHQHPRSSLSGQVYWLSADLRLWVCPVFSARWTALSIRNNGICHAFRAAEFRLWLPNRRRSYHQGARPVHTWIFPKPRRDW